MNDGITQGAVALALGAAGIGAGGAVIAQLIAGLLSGRRDSQRLQWEKTRALREERRDIFVSFLQSIALRYRLYTDAAVLTGREQASAETEIDSTADRWWDEFTAKLIEVKLAAPELSENIDSASALFAEWEGTTWSDGVPKSDYYRKLGDRYLDLRKTLETQMQISLGFNSE